MKKISMIAGLFALGFAARAEATQPANPPFRIQVTDVYGPGCVDPYIVTVQTNVFGEYYIDARFYEQSGEGFASETNAHQTTDRSDCTIKYNLYLENGYILDYADFVVDGEYDLSELGSASLSVRYNIPGSLSEPDIAFKSFRAENDPAQDAFILAGDIEVNDSRINYCGAAIPLEIQVRSTARRGRDDARDTYIRIDNGEGRTGVHDLRSLVRCHVRVRPC